MAEAIPTRKRHRVFEIDDGGSFDRLVEETRRIVRMRDGTEAEAIDLLQCRVLEGFVGRLQKNSMAKKSDGDSKKRAEERKEKSQKSGCLGAQTEKKKTTRNRVLGESEGNCKSKKVKTGNDKKAGKRICLEEEQRYAPPPKVPSYLEKRIKEKGGTDIKMVIKKKLTSTDLSKPQGRLLIPVKQMMKDVCFLTEEEETILSSEEKRSNEIRVMVMEPCGVDSEMVMVKWNMQKSKNYGLRTGWSTAIKRNHEEVKHLAVDQVIQLWSFRVGPQLWFAIYTDVPASSSSSSSSESHRNIELEDQSTVED